MHQKQLIILVLFGSALLSSPRLYGGDDQVVDVTQMPGTVIQALEAVAPGSTWFQAKREATGGKTEYEVTGTTARGGAIEVELEVDQTGSAKVVKTETRPGTLPGKFVDAAASSEADDRPWLWPLGLALLAIVGFIAQAIFEDVFQAIGRSIARGLGIDRLGEKLEKRLQRRRSGQKIVTAPDHSQPRPDTGEF